MAKNKIGMNWFAYPIVSNMTDLDKCFCSVAHIADCNAFLVMPICMEFPGTSLLIAGVNRIWRVGGTVPGVTLCGVGAICAYAAP